MIKNSNFSKYRPFLIALILILETAVLVALELGYVFAKLELANNFDNLSAHEILRANNNAEIFQYVACAFIFVIAVINQKIAKKWWLRLILISIPVIILISVTVITYAVLTSASVF